MSGERGRSRNSSGYVLFGVLVGVTLMGIGLTAAVTLWSRVVQRDREAELIFRGEAVVRALERFQQDRPGTLPETLDELVEGKYLRRAWLDPMTGRSFRILRAEDRLGAAASAADTARAGRKPTNPAGEEARPRAGEISAGEAAGTSEATTGITGVVSTSDLLSFRTYQDARRYRDWVFEAQIGGAAGAESENRRSAGEREER